MKLPRINFWTAFTIVAFAILFLFVLYPLLSLFKASFLSPTSGGITLEGYYSFLKDSFYRSSLLNSLFLSALVTIGSLILGIMLAFFVRRYEFPLKSLVKILPLITFILPSVVVAQSWILLLGRSGFLSLLFQKIGLEIPNIYGWKGVVLVLIFQHYAYVFLMVSSAMSSMDASLEEAAQNLGMSPLRTYLTVTLPVIAPSIFASGLVVFTLAIENFGIPLILGEGFPVLAVVAYKEFVKEMGGEPLMASTLSMILLLTTSLALIIQKRIVGKKVYQMTSRRVPPTKALCLVHRIFVMAFCFSLIALSLSPVLVTYIASFTKTIGPVMYFGEFSIKSYRTAFIMAPRPIYNSFFLATMATIIGFFFATFVSYILVRKSSKITYVLDTFAMFPLAVAGTVLGIGLITTFNKGVLILTGSWVIMLIAYFVRKVPFAIRASSSVLYNIKVSLEDASINLGVPPLRTFFKVVVPLMLPGIIAGALLMWVTTLAEFSATIVLYFGEWSTMPIKIFHQIDSGEFGPASAYGAILITSILLPLFLAIKCLKIDVFGAK
ncbi:MAG: iron ABC transporter permease [Thermodesulfobacteriota bacterium]|nr:iron ABC transporter permease [Thermodesulfobacteriota bacterium]